MFYLTWLHFTLPPVPGHPDLTGGRVTAVHVGNPSKSGTPPPNHGIAATTNLCLMVKFIVEDTKGCATSPNDYCILILAPTVPAGPRALNALKKRITLRATTRVRNRLRGTIVANLRTMVIDPANLPSITAKEHVMVVSKLMCLHPAAAQAMTVSIVWQRC